MKPRYYSISGLANEFGIDRRVIALRLGAIAPEGKTTRGHDGWSLKTFWAAATAERNLTNRGDADCRNYSTERAKLVAEKARLAELDRRQREGELASIAEFRDAAMIICSEVRTKMLAVPTRVGAQWVIIGTAAEAQALVKKEIYAALAALARFDEPACS